MKEDSSDRQHSENEWGGDRCPLNLPPFEMKLRRGEGSRALSVFDAIRGKYVALTPEEYVRQHFVNWLTTELHYPKSHIANELKINLNGTVRRCDTVVFEDASTPLMIIEYKAPNVPVNQKVFDQIVRYNMVLRARYLVVSNGINHYCCAIDYRSGNYYFIPQVPDYQKLKQAFGDN